MKRLTPGVHMNPRWLWLVCASIAVFGSATTQVLRAQEFRATITGQVTDPSGGAIPRATIKATQVDTQQAYSATCDGSGIYSLPYLLPGKYTVIVEASGFANDGLRQRSVRIGAETKPERDAGSRRHWPASDRNRRARTARHRDCWGRGSRGPSPGGQHAGHGAVGVGRPGICPRRQDAQRRLQHHAPRQRVKPIRSAERRTTLMPFISTARR